MKRNLIYIAFTTLVIFIVACFTGCDEDFCEFCEEIVDTNEGPVVGSFVKVEDYSGNDVFVCTYKGIPYAAPLVADLRWKPPQSPIQHQEDLLYADEFGPDCMQKSSTSPSGMAEDCLYLNIWRPAKEGKFPVMFWIHGGGFEAGSGADSKYKGDGLAANKDVVFVNINYRLGALGYLAHEDLVDETDSFEGGSAGNYGLLDQIAALKWIKENIANFGGDPENITIFGHSAGGKSVFHLLSSPLAKGLFQKAIVQSGGSETVHTSEKAFSRGAHFADALGCDDENQADCLRSQSAKALIRALSRIKIDGILEGSLRVHYFAPRINDRVMPGKPVDLIAAGNFNNVPLMMGSNHYEGRIITGILPTNIVLEPLVSWLTDLILGGYLKDLVNMDDVIGFYPKDEFPEYADVIGAMFFDINNVCSTYEGFEAAPLYQPDTYYYRFDYDDHTLGDRFGTMHGMEIPYILGNIDKDSLFMDTSDIPEAKIMSQAMMTYWTNFAMYGDPNGPDLPHWPVFKPGNGVNKMFFDLPGPYAGENENVEKCECYRDVDLYN